MKTLSSSISAMRRGSIDAKEGLGEGTLSRYECMAVEVGKGCQRGDDGTDGEFLYLPAELSF